MLWIAVACACVMSACLGALVAVQMLTPPARRWSLFGRRRQPLTIDEAIEEAIREQLDHERSLVRVGIHFWSQQRERAVVQRVERKLGKVSTTAMEAFVRRRLLQVEVVNLSPHKPKR